MSTKLTLSIDEKVVAEAKEYAKEAGKSVSQIVESYLRVLTQKNNKHTPSLPAHISRWQGAFKSTGKKNYKEVYTTALTEKYGKK
ncbi:MAG: DUF6364 family protein [Sediminibacterium sp.]|jgi:hypothetical protein|nr:hypothetical protein [Chitinophagaceae bacterium]MCA6448458.1 hypothetical protein [Chitinophagaceae bacterium]